MSDCLLVESRITIILTKHVQKCKPGLDSHGHVLPGVGAASERYQLDPRVGGHLDSDVVAALTEGRDGAREAVPLQDAAHDANGGDGRERRGRSSLPEHHVTANLR